MKRIITLPLVVLCLAAFAPPLHAEHDFAPDRRDMRKIRELSRDLEREAEDLEGRIKPNFRSDRGRHDRDRDRLIALAERFTKEAEDFDEIVRHNMERPERTVYAFRDLRGSYHSLTQAIRRTGLDHRDKRHLHEVDVLMSKIGEYYEGRRRPEVDWRRVQFLAHEVDDLAEKIYDGARRDLSRYGGPHNNYRIREAIARFDHLRDAARHFHRQVEQGRRDPEHIRSDFERLLAANDVANRYVWYLSYGTRRDLQRLGSLLDELDSRCYEGRHRRRHVDARPPGPAPLQSRPTARTVDFEEDWPQLLISLLGGDLKF